MFGGFEMRSFQEVYDYYQAVVYPQREKLVSSLETQLGLSKETRILDCACGTGLPALDLRRLGYRVDCSDGDELMLEQFRANARTLGVSDEAWHLRWEQLETLEAQYDFVFCRGNSLVYADSWGENEKKPSTEETLRQNVRHLESRVVPGGYLLVDAPLSSDLPKASYPRISFRGESVSVNERVSLSGSTRRWEVTLTIRRSGA